MDNLIVCAALFFGPVAFCAFLLGCHAFGRKLAAALESRQ